MKKIKKFVVIIICAFFCTIASAKSLNESWKNVLPDIHEHLSDKEIKEYIDEIKKSIPDINAACPLPMTDFTSLSSISLDKSNLEFYVDYFGPMEFFLYEIDKNKEEFNTTKRITGEEVLRRILALLNVEDAPDVDLSDFVIAFVESGKKVTLNMVFGPDDLSADEYIEKNPGIQVILYPDGRIGDVSLMTYQTQSQIAIVKQTDGSKTPVEEEEDYQPVKSKVTVKDSKQKDNTKKNSPYDQDAQFPGGETALIEWLSENVNYPEEAADNGIRGKVVVKFAIEKDGSIGEAIIVNGVEKSLDREALRVVWSMPKWIPAKIGGKPVKSYFNLPITFDFAN